jgi:hypothetical protein
MEVDTEDDDPYENFENSQTLYEANSHYTELMCMKDIDNKKRTDETINIFFIGIKVLGNRKNLSNKCVLPLGHVEKCCSNFNCIFKKNDITKKLISSISCAIYSTPGNDDYFFKNRANRLFEYTIYSNEEKKLRDKKEKKKCAIPLKDASTPILLAQAYLDWITYLVSVEDIRPHLVEDCDESILTIINKNKIHLISVFKKFNREIFNEDGYSMCVITRNVIKLSDVSDPSRDNRVNIRDSDIQLGHNYPRSERYVSIRGENLIPMCRRGNLIIGERIFTEDIWIDELKRILIPY